MSSIHEKMDIQMKDFFSNMFQFLIKQFFVVVILTVVRHHA